MCKVMPTAPSSYYEHKRRKRNPELAPKRVRHDQYLQGEMRRIWGENYEVYGYRKVWRQLLRENIPAGEMQRRTPDAFFGAPRRCQGEENQNYQTWKAGATTS
jgi:HTH-like domain